MAFFDFLSDLPPFSENPAAIARLNRRHDMVLKPLKREIDGARVLDVAAHDGRWSLAFAALGAREVKAVEGRPELVERFAHFPKPGAKKRVQLVQGDLYPFLDAEIAAGESYDVVALLGIFYHIMEHFRLLRQAVALRPKLIIIDSAFAQRPGPVIALQRERTDKALNAIAQVDGQEVALVGYPSPSALEAMADVLGYRTDWVDWSVLPGPERKAVPDYFRKEGHRRATALLRPAHSAKLRASHFSSQ